MGDPTDSNVPTSTYRLHLTGEFTLHDAADLVDHIDRLGVDWVYASPIQTVPEGATHGYHILDPDQINPELGGDAGLAALRSAIDDHGRSLVLDIVPNHMAASVENGWWRDVLARGRDSTFAHFFDIDFDAGPIVLPVLGGSVEDAIASGAVAVVEYHGTPMLDVHGTRYPLAEGTNAAEPILEILGQQAYELAQWREGEGRLNWRRFFAVNELAGLRVEDPIVFEAVHSRLFDLVGNGVIDGLRVDHIDGLSQPGEYLEQLRQRVGTDHWLVVEKIVEVTTAGGDVETVPPEWPIQGTTGYEVGALIQSWLTDGHGHRRLADSFAAATGMTLSTVAALPESKLDVLGELFGAEVDRVATTLSSENHTVAELAQGVSALAAHLEGYRTYAPASGPLQPADLDAIDRAATEADSQSARVVAELLVRPENRSALLRWQQLTGPATAKGFEDRLMFRHVALGSLAEVGADAAYLDAPPDADASSRMIADRARQSPHAGTTTSTHDTKRSEDVRARLLVLAEVPELYQQTLAAIGTALGGEQSGGTSIDAHAIWLVSQAVIGTMGLAPGSRAGDDPDQLYRDRISAWTGKAIREADLRTSHRDPDPAYEQAVQQWVDALLAPGPALDAVRELVQVIEVAGATNSLATVVLKIIAPGVPDIYRGCEIWDDSLTDPDNRRPLQVDRLRRTMTSLEGASPQSLLDGWRDGALKMHITRQSLHARRDRPQTFLSDRADVPAVSGALADNVCALLRSAEDGSDAALAVTPRLPYVLAGRGWAIGDVWRDTAVTLPTNSSEPVKELLTGRILHPADGRIGLSELMRDLPVALLRL